MFSPTIILDFVNTVPSIQYPTGGFVNRESFDRLGLDREGLDRGGLDRGWRGCKER